MNNGNFSFAIKKFCHCREKEYTYFGAPHLLKEKRETLKHRGAKSKKMNYFWCTF